MPSARLESQSPYDLSYTALTLYAVFKLRQDAGSPSPLIGFPGVGNVNGTFSLAYDPDGNYLRCRMHRSDAVENERRVPISVGTWNVLSVVLNRPGTGAAAMLIRLNGSSIGVLDNSGGQMFSTFSNSQLLKINPRADYAYKHFQIHRTAHELATVQAWEAWLNEKYVVFTPQVFHQEILTNTDPNLTWTVPTDVTELRILCIGSGGGGEAAHSSRGGGGGGGGGSVRGCMTVTPGQEFEYQVGIATGVGSAGIPTTFASGISPFFMQADTGGPGAGGNGGAGGGSNNALGSNVTGSMFSGGNGANRTVLIGGGGGGSGGSVDRGGNGGTGNNGGSGALLSGGPGGLGGVLEGDNYSGGGGGGGDGGFITGGGTHFPGTTGNGYGSGGGGGSSTATGAPGLPGVIVIEYMAPV